MTTPVGLGWGKGAGVGGAGRLVKKVFIKKNSPNYVGKWSCVEGYHMSNKTH